MPGPNAWQKNRDSLAGHIIAEGLLKIEAGISSNPQSLLQPSNPESMGAIHAAKDPAPQLIGYLQGPIYAPLRVLPFNENELTINSLEMNDLDIELESLEPLSGFSEVDLESKELTVEPLNSPELGIELSDDSELRVELFKDSELHVDVEIDQLPSLDAEPGINGAFDTNNMTSGQLNPSASLNKWGIELPGGDLEEDENDAEADILMGIILLEYLWETEDMRGPYGQIPTSKDWFAVSMMWKGDMFRGVYR
ncbi:hypothetical protein RSAG8_11501, partial [Rhizoctonia solani AG-8 WAC10335]